MKKSSYQQHGESKEMECRQMFKDHKLTTDLIADGFAVTGRPNEHSVTLNKGKTTLKIVINKPKN